MNVQGMPTNMGMTPGATGQYSFIEITQTELQPALTALNTILRPAGGILTATIDTSTGNVTNISLMTVPNWNLQQSVATIT